MAQLFAYSLAMLLWLAGLAGPPPAEEIPTPPDPPPAITAPAGTRSVCEQVYRGEAPGL